MIRRSVVACGRLVVANRHVPSSLIGACPIPLERTLSLHRCEQWQTEFWPACHRFTAVGHGRRRSFSSGAHVVSAEQEGLRTALSQRCLQALQLKTYSDEEIGAAFDRADLNGNGLLEQDEIQQLLGDVEISNLCACLGVRYEGEQITKSVFVKGVADLSERLDSRIYPIAISLMLTGFSVGVFAPALPLLITDLGITTAQIGVMTSAFGVCKLLGNIPFGVAADKYGRQPVIVFGGGFIAAGTFIVGLGPIFSSWVPLVLGRCVNGVGVAGLITGAFTAAADISNPRNSARTMAPIGAGFNFGNAMGPCVGGVLIGVVGTAPALLSCSMLLGLNAVASMWLIKETRPLRAATNLGFLEAYKASTASWPSLLKRAELRQVTIYQAVFWGAMGGGFMTAVPIVLGSAKLGLAASSLGFVYGGIAAINVVAAQPLAVMTDYIGKLPSMIGGMGLLGISLSVLPLCTDIPSLSLVLGGWAVSSTLLFNVPQAIVADVTNEQERSSALAMVRTLGDVGLVVGGVGASLLGTVSSTDVILAAAGGSCMVTCVSTMLHRWKLGSGVQPKHKDTLK